MLMCFSPDGQLFSQLTFMPMFCLKEGRTAGLASNKKIRFKLMKRIFYFKTNVLSHFTKWFPRH
jgi:hypothetical protein